jgi:hypothetical protein
MIISYRAGGEICGNSHESSEIVKCHLSQILLSTLWTRSSVATDGRPLCSLSWSHLRTFYIIVLQFRHTLHFGHKLCIIPMDFHSTRVLRVKKPDNGANFTAGGIINHRTLCNSLCRDKNKQQLCYGLQSNESCDATLHARAVSCTYISWPKLNGGYFPNSPCMIRY